MVFVVVVTLFVLCGCCECVCVVAVVVIAFVLCGCCYYVVVVAYVFGIWLLVVFFSW